MIHRVTLKSIADVQVSLNAVHVHYLVEVGISLLTPMSALPFVRDVLGLLPFDIMKTVADEISFYQCVSAQSFKKTYELRL